MIAFKTIRARAAKRKGGEKALSSLLPKVPSQKALASLKDDRVLAEMAKRVFSAGFVWSVIEKKWPGFEAAFLKFEPKRLNFQPDEFWEGLTGDDRIVRNGAKIASVRDNARFIAEIAKEHGSFGKFLAGWPADDQVGLLEVLAKRGSRLGGMTGQYFLRFVGKDVFITSRDMIASLRDAGLDISETASSKKDLRKIQDLFNAWAEETGLPYTHLSRICAMSVGENYDAETLRRRGGGEE
ncbi:MAG TPA: DNA-3-methyladenine glycosylase I [Hyphomicrobiaceae bacterium]|jgi:3-methyladenine DNA glycosylase Tag|nr:DNA-3-methyladenine glycosylase I [Hyphomicrobiaceae bacterium]